MIYSQKVYVLRVHMAHSEKVILSVILHISSSIIELYNEKNAGEYIQMGFVKTYNFWLYLTRKYFFYREPLDFIDVL